MSHTPHSHHLRTLGVAGVLVLAAGLAGCGTGASGPAVSSSVAASAPTHTADGWQETVHVTIRNGNQKLPNFSIGFERSSDKSILDKEKAAANDAHRSADDSFPFWFYYPLIWNSAGVYDSAPSSVSTTPLPGMTGGVASINDPEEEQLNVPDVQEAPDPEVVDVPDQAPEPEAPDYGESGDVVNNDGGGGDYSPSDGGGDPAPVEEAPVEEAPIEEGLGAQHATPINIQTVAYRTDGSSKSTTPQHDGLAVVGVKNLSAGSGVASCTLGNNDVECGDLAPGQRVDIAVVLRVPDNVNDVAFLALSSGNNVIVPGAGSTDAWAERALG